jgi:hypothetical protein
MSPITGYDIGRSSEYETGIIVQDQPFAANARITVAASVLGPLCPPLQGIHGAVGVHAHEPGPQGFDREARTVAVVQLQQLLLEPSVVAACPIHIDYVHLPDNYQA